jgi:hypothetical protein
MDPACWRCGAGPQPPPLEDQVDILRRVHGMNGEPWASWSDREWLRLRERLVEGDVLAVLTGRFLSVEPSYGSVTVLRGSTIVNIDRRELADS